MTDSPFPNHIPYDLNIGQMNHFIVKVDDVDRKKMIYQPAHETPELGAVPGRIYVPRDLDAKYAAEIGEARELDVQDPTQLDMVKSSAKTRVVATSDEIGSAMKYGVPRSEVDAFAIKEEAARTFLGPVAVDPLATNPPPPDGDEALSPAQRLILESEAEITGETLEELSRKIVVQADGFRKAAGTISGLRRKTTQLIDEAATIAEVEQLLRDFKVEADDAKKRAVEFKVKGKDRMKPGHKPEPEPVP